MKKVLTLSLVAALILSVLGVCAVVAASAADGYTVTVSDQLGLSAENPTTTDGPVVYSNCSLAADAALPATFSCLAKVDNGGTDPLRYYTAIVNGTEDKTVVTANYNAGSNGSTVFVTLAEGTYSEIIIRCSDIGGNSYDVLKFVNLTVTAPERSVSEEGWEVSTTPCWTVGPTDLANGSSGNALSIAESEDGYVTFTSTEKGDPYLYYISGTETVTGRFLLIKYNNHSTIPRMQIYMAQQAGISSDNNMIEFEIAANRSGWTYVVVDLSQNSFYNAETQSLFAFRFDPLEARNWSNGAYVFAGDEAIDVAYIKGFTTRAGLEGYLEANELHDVTKTATLLESQLTPAGDGFTYTDKKGDVYPVTRNEDGTYSYTFQARDVRIPVNAKPVLLLDGSKLIGVGHHGVEQAKDDATGVVTLTATEGDVYYRLFNQPTQAARYMAIRYKTTVEDQMEMFLSSTDTDPLGGQSFKRPLVATGEWHTEIIDLSTVGVSSLNTETYMLNFLRFDFFDTKAEGVMEVEYVAFFDSEDAAFQYEHTFKTYIITFTANNQVVAKVAFEAGATSVTEPAVPTKEGYVGSWSAYTMADKNFTVKAVYTLIDVPTEPATTVAEPETTAPEPETTAAEPETTAPVATTPSTTVAATAPADPATTPVESTQPTATAAGTDSTATEGCSSVIGGAVVILMSALVAGVAIRKKKD